MTRTFLAIALLAAGCNTVQWPTIPDVPDTPTNTTPPVVATGIIASGSFVRPAVTVADDGTVYVAAEGPAMKSVWFYRSNGDSWTGGKIVESQIGGPADASRVYVPDIAEDAGTVWISMRLGTKEGGSMHGPGLYTWTGNAGSFRFTKLTTGAARLAAYNGSCFMLSKNGTFGQFDKSGNLVKVGTFPAGLTGEKFAFAIAPDGKWHSVHNGSAFEPSAYAVTGISRKTWADLATYPDQADDLRYPSICVVQGKAYASSVHGGRNRIQVMEAGRPRYSIAALPSLGTATMEQRCPPRLVAAPGGAVAIWRDGKSIVAVNVESCLAGKAKPARVATGEYPAAAVGPDGAIHLVYVQGANLKHEIMEAP